MLSAYIFSLYLGALIFQHISCCNDRHEAQPPVSDGKGFGATTACFSSAGGVGAGIPFLLLCGLCGV